MPARPSLTFQPPADNTAPGQSTPGAFHRELEILGRCAGVSSSTYELTAFQRGMTGGESVQGMKVLAIVLILVGVIALAYEGISYTTREKVLEVGPITATKETTKTIPLPPILGGAAVVCGVVLLIAAARP
jgi:hypothetical protein